MTVAVKYIVDDCSCIFSHSVKSLSHVAVLSVTLVA